MSKTKLTFKGCHRCGEQIGWDETPNPICSDCAVERITELEAENAKLRACVEPLQKLVEFIELEGPASMEWKAITEWTERGREALARAEVDK